MEIKISEIKSPANVTVLQVTGKLDGSNYLDLIEEARRVYMDGTRSPDRYEPTDLYEQRRDRGHP